MVYPHFYRFFDRNTIVVEECNTEVAHLYVIGLYKNKSPVAQPGIVTDTLDGYLHGNRVVFTFQLHGIGITIKLPARCIDIAYDTNSKRTGLQTFFVCFQNFTQTGTCSFGFSIENRQLHIIDIILVDIQHTGVFFECTVIIIGTYCNAVFMGKTVTVVSLNTYCFGFGGAAGYDTAAIRGFYLEHIIAGLQSQSIGTSIPSVVTNQFFVQLLPVCLRCSFYIYIIHVGSLVKLPRHVGTLVPTHYLLDRYLRPCSAEACSQQ